MKDAKQAAKDLIVWARQAQYEETVRHVTRILEARDREVAEALRDAVDVALRVEVDGLVGQGAYYVKRARKIVQRAAQAFCGKAARALEEPDA